MATLVLAKKLLTLCQKRHLTLALAESCTGGSISAYLTKIPGASQCFAGSIISYQNSAKMRLLGVSKKLLNQFSAVSLEVANQMLIGALTQFSADIAAAITGIAGPDGGTTQIPVGTVYVALGGKNFQRKHLKFFLTGTRKTIIEKAVDETLQHLILMIIESEV